MRVAPGMSIPEVDEERLEKEGLSVSAVTDWGGRPKRARRPPPKSYWEEFVATDEWYIRELTADVPADEWQAAVEEENWAEGEGESGDEGEESASEGSGEEDPDYSEDEASVEDGSDPSSEWQELSDDELQLTSGSGPFSTPERSPSPGSDTPTRERPSPDSVNGSSAEGQ